MRKSLLRTVGVFVATIMLCLGALPAYADEPEIDCSIEGNCYRTRAFKTNDAIRYDNSETGWEIVKVYIWGNNNYYGNTAAFDWDTQRPTMTRIGDTDIWEYKIPTVEEYCEIDAGSVYYQDCVDYYSQEEETYDFCDNTYYTYEQDYSFNDCLEKYSNTTLTKYDGLWASYDHLLFSDNEGGSYETGKQTANLSFIDSGYIYKSECIVGGQGCRFQDDEAQGKWRGLWYLYDKLSLIDTLNAAKAYADEIACINEEEAKIFVNLVNDIDSNINDYFVVQTDPAATSGWYWTYSGVAIDELSAQIESVKTKYGENPTLCKESDNPDTFDAIGLYVGLGVASVIGLAVEFSIKRRI